ncbi:MAG TPA: iron-containing alcohol dehydrogenase [Myxococcota bacterium]|nr:iron-containing alcohol dehydrogenase [Myxococcota bacterium]HQK50393.1 iron-containing alcohol dehydrogenase [Myxococcota bacterium]
MTFDLFLPRHVRFGPGVSLAAPEGIRGIRRVLLVTGRDAGRHPRVQEALQQAGVYCFIVRVFREPTVDDAREAVRAAREEGCQGVVALGGGSVLDLGKAVAGLLGNPGDPMDYLEVVGLGRPMERPAVPLVAIPTTAGTGSEVTRNAVLAVPEARVKASLRSPFLLPAMALVDPDLTEGVPPEVTAWCGMDALVQLVEPFTSARAHPFTDALCREAIPRAVEALPRAFRDGSDREARQEMALASLFGGLALANGGLGAAHGLAAAIGGGFSAPHGALCARLIWPVVRINHRKAREVGDRRTEQRYRDLGRLLTGNPQAGVQEAVTVLQGLVDTLGIPRLGAWGVRDSDLDALAQAGSRAGSMKANPVSLSLEDLREILAQAL